MIVNDGRSPFAIDSRPPRGAPRLPLRVVKVGGSLLAGPELPRAIQGWLATQSPALNVLVCGGGPLAEAIRQADRDFALGEEISHWLSIDALAISAKLLAAILPDVPLLTTFVDLETRIATQQPGAVIFDPREFLLSRESQLAGTSLPHSWRATSDSIAARLAEVLCADELVLLKSAAPPAADLAALAALGYVDAHFPWAARNIASIRFVNLRSAVLRKLTN
jgi:aspartokinase-like uncharacterized kinase